MSLASLRLELVEDIELPFQFLFESEPVSRRQEPLFKITEVGNTKVELGRTVVTICIQDMDFLPSSSSSILEQPVKDSVEDQQKDDPSSPPRKKMFLQKMDACTVKGIKIFTAEEINDSTGDTKTYRQFHNKHARQLCKTNLPLKKIYENINELWKKQKDESYVYKSPQVIKNKNLVERLNEEIENHTKKGGNVTGLKSKLRKAKDALRKSCSRERSNKQI